MENEAEVIQVGDSTSEKIFVLISPSGNTDTHPYLFNRCYAVYLQLFYVSFCNLLSKHDMFECGRSFQVTRKNLERHLQRQVVLDDGRVIEEDEPEVTRDLVEDTQTHEDRGSEERNIVGSSWSPGGSKGG